MNFETQQIHAAFKSNRETGSRAIPIYQTASYQFRDTAHAKALFELEEPGNIYTRIGNPTTAILEDRMASLEKGVGALAVASGHAAQFISLTTIAKQGDQIVASPLLYGGTYNQLNVLLRNFGIDTHFTQDLSLSAFENRITKKTKAIYVETIGNPSFKIPDLKALSGLAAHYRIPLIVDNTFGAGGYFCTPIDFGATIITHSATKWIGGHGTSMGGIIIDSGNFDWHNDKFPLLSQPSEGYHGITFGNKFGKKAFIARARAEILRDMGAVQSPFNSFQILQGLETLALRASRQSENALTLAKWLKQHPKVKSVSYPGLESHPDYALAKKYLKNGFGGVLNFEVAGNINAATKIIDSFRLVAHMANVGDNKTLAIQPAATTHQQLNIDQQKAAGVTPTQIRISLGIEHIDDILEDFEQALKSN